MSYYHPYSSAQPYPPNHHQSQPQLQSQPQRQYATPQDQAQVGVPPPHPQFSPPQHQPPLQFQFQPQLQPYHYPQFQQVPQIPSQQYDPNIFYQYNQQGFKYDQPIQQRYEPPPPPKVIVPPVPSQHQNQFQQTSPMPRQTSAAANQMSVKQPTPQARVLQDVRQPQPSTSPQMKAKPRDNFEQPGIPSTQYPSLLLTLADEYVEASKKLQQRSKEYYQLISTAIGCIDVALRNFKLGPLREAQLSLKYSQLLYDETNNLDEAETVLTKSIDLCERMKFIDLKYAMQLLLTKVLFRSRPRAAMRDLQAVIQDIETYRHVAWEYPFRFQAVFFTAEASNYTHLQESFHQLERIQHVAKLNTDHVVYAYAAVIESLLHLHNPGPEGIAASQQAMAKARSLQLNPDVEKHPQMPVLMEIIDLVWSIGTANEAEIAQKRKNLKDSIYTKSIDNPAWARDESTWLRINSSSLKGIPTQEGGLIHSIDGKYYMSLHWMGKKELEAIGFLLMGVALIPQNRQQKNKAEKFFHEGYPIVKEELLGHDAMLGGKDQTLSQRCHEICMHFKAEAALLCCAQGQWQKADGLVRQVAWHLKQTQATPQKEFEALLAYLKGCVAQGIGDLTTALNMFQSKHLAIQTKNSSQTPSSKTQTQIIDHTVQNLRLLAAVNTALIIRAPSHPRHQQLQPLVDTIGTHVTPSVPPIISATYSFLRATLPNTTVLQMKQLLNSALEVARKLANNQIISLTLTLMQDRFFRGGVQNTQAVKCAKAAVHQVKTRWGSPLWIAVAGLMEVESMLLQPDPTTYEEAELKRRDIAQKQNELQQAWVNVPETVRAALAREETNEESILRNHTGR